ncbi:MULTISPECIES: sugar ABC transporter ATP-binding protein [Micrococcaceae]|uniref:Ribose ABC transporter, ATP-binding protein n=1 Tax=Paenarthrobacter aurescens (strain TC1) TaxID=290340 RepID=A1R6K4_PAEAT|nr:MULTISPECIES: sugar ABC transporter ATP-binding protein [Micrococcaceae]ABM08181.1 ribose ABC transporter, ATP-binding protein [Paenarthrobacter aurescens TC1]MBP2265761.1 ribose transport system ATP-binding protein [Pseudarthrobacter sp. PvP004]
MDLLLRADDIHASYDHRRILKGVGLSVQRGEILGLIGTNGAGKTTLMGVLAGSHKHDAGLMTLAGEKYGPDSMEEAQACGVGLIPQNFRIDPQLSIAEAIFRGTFQAGKPHHELRNQASELIRDIGISLDPDTKVGTLIRAEQALVEVLRMVAEEAQLVIMDEVAASLPDHDVAVLHQVLRMLVRQGRAIIYITHRLDEVRSIAHRIAVLREGRVHKILEASSTDIDELAFLLLQQELEGNARPTDPAGGDEALRVVNLSMEDRVREVTFNVAKGEIFGLAGTHRSGVYELVEALAGVRPSTSGHIHLHGEPVQIRGVQDALRLKIGYLSDAADNGEATGSIMDGLQASANGGAANLQDEVTQLRGVVEVIRRMRISTTNIHGDISTLSGGDRQKVQLAQWMATGCDVLILSHPSRGIDIGAKDAVYKMLNELSQTGVAIILLSSDLSELVSWCHRIGVMRDGELVTIEANANTNEDVLVHHMLGVKFETGGSEARRVRN